MLATGGVTPYAWNLASGNLPAGVSLSRQGVLSGTPTGSGNFSFTVAVADSQQPPDVANGSFTLTINAALQVTTTSLPNGLPSVAYSSMLAAAGAIAPYTWSITQGSLPSGLTLNATSGVISGVPMSSGTSTFTVQVADSEMPADNATANLSITINPMPARNAALYTSASTALSGGGMGLKINPDGSLTPMPSSPETAILNGGSAVSPTLPLLFMNPGGVAESILVNPDYSLTTNSTAALPGTSFFRPSVDPTGSNLYILGEIDNNHTPGITIFPGDGSLQPIGTLAVPNANSRIVFTPDGTLGFLVTCSNSAIVSFSRAANGMLTQVASTAVVTGGCFAALAVSPDGKYLADDEIQIYSIASSGALTPILPQPFVISLTGRGLFVQDLMWDPSGAYLMASATQCADFFCRSYIGGLDVLSFSGTTLTEIVPPTGVPVGRLQRAGPFIYGMGATPPQRGFCSLGLIDGYTF